MRQIMEENDGTRKKEKNLKGGEKKNFFNHFEGMT